MSATKIVHTYTGGSAAKEANVLALLLGIGMLCLTVTGSFAMLMLGVSIIRDMFDS